MQALIRAQTTIRSQRSSGALVTAAAQRPDPGARRSTSIFQERFDDAGSEYESSVHSRRLSSSVDTGTITNTLDESPKIVEMDTAGSGRPRSSRSRRTMIPPGGDPYDDTACQLPPLSSTLPGQAPGRLFIPEGPSGLETEPADCWVAQGDENCQFSTAHSTPRFLVCRTPSRSVCGDNFFGSYYYNPSYMANTRSSEAKQQLRSHSAPKQRPEHPAEAAGRSYSPKRVSLNELMESRSSLSGVRMRRSCSRVQEAINFKNAVMGKLYSISRSGELGRNLQAHDISDHYHGRRF
ncbi:hypothetical protein SAY86_026624 [Trapa natans]|uniref:DUF4005 domain-containing protein n=1 Tax=Trapa natans TaxID=22666 RepID=A0AAN7KE09_TRANT|nr:hypothetical protein SAY86_026624 [Trapa natans]